jgi:hypothetical protein
MPRELTAYNFNADTRIKQLIADSDDLQERSVVIQAKASRTSQMAANIGERSQRLITGMQRAEWQLPQSRFSHLRDNLVRAMEAVIGIDRLLDEYHGQALRDDAEGIKAGIVTRMTQLDALSTVMTELSKDAAIIVDRELQARSNERA